MNEPYSFLILLFGASFLHAYTAPVLLNLDSVPSSLDKAQCGVYSGREVWLEKSENSQAPQSPFKTLVSNTV